MKLRFPPPWLLLTVFIFGMTAILGLSLELFWFFGPRSPGAWTLLTTMALFLCLRFTSWGRRLLMPVSIAVLVATLAASTIFVSDAQELPDDVRWLVVAAVCAMLLGAVLMRWGMAIGEALTRRFGSRSGS